MTLQKIYIYNQDFSSVMKRGREEVIKNGVKSYNTAVLPAYVYWRCMDVIESAGMKGYEFNFRFLVALANQLNHNQELGKPTPDCALMYSESGDYGFLHVYLYNEATTREFKETYSGRQIPIRDKTPQGEQVTEIKNIQSVYEGKESGRIKVSFNKLSDSVLKPAMNNEPEASTVEVDGDSLVFMFEQGSDLYQLLDTASSEMSHQIADIPDRNQVLADRKVRTNQLALERKVEKKSKKLMTPEEFYQTRKKDLPQD